MMMSSSGSIPFSTERSGGSSVKRAMRSMITATFSIVGLLQYFFFLGSDPIFRDLQTGDTKKFMLRMLYHGLTDI